MWSLPYDASRDAFYLPAGVIPVYDEICRCVVNVIQSCCNSNSVLIKTYVTHLVLLHLSGAMCGLVVIGLMYIYLLTICA